MMYLRGPSKILNGQTGSHKLKQSFMKSLFKILQKQRVTKNSIKTLKEKYGMSHFLAYNQDRTFSFQV